VSRRTRSFIATKAFGAIRGRTVRPAPHQKVKPKIERRVARSTRLFDSLTRSRSRA
jgi:hypothetical protein